MPPTPDPALLPPPPLTLSLLFAVLSLSLPPSLSRARFLVASLPVSLRAQVPSLLAHRPAVSESIDRGADSGIGAGSGRSTAGNSSRAHPECNPSTSAA
eukprot:2645097-Rhodomonas_salina.1